MTKEQYKNEHGGAPAPSELLVDNEIEETASTWVKMLGNLFNYMPSGLSWNTSIPDDASTAHERRDCSLMDTTPFNDLEQFSTALVALAGDTRIPPWTRETSYTDIPICKQQETWDCGVACIQMILAWLRDEDNADVVAGRRQWMLDTLQTKSIWTIDLMILLNTMCQNDDINGSLLLCSKTLGVDRKHNTLHYYERAFGEDQIRVDRLFEKANDLDLNMVSLSHLGLAHVIRLVAQPHIVAMMLLDNSILRGTRNTYAGHYVVLCGMSCEPAHIRKAKQTDRKSTDDYCMVIKNPGGINAVDYVTPYLLEKAWRGKGTDDDIIFVARRGTAVSYQTASR